ncbi:MAG: 3-keto-steroid reductase [Sclerophora amabilis]|nr:MAG: 3-keto-steroid reductase [Sclerophora amabilis]
MKKMFLYKELTRNSGLGFAICCRLMDEAYPTYKALTIIFTTRTTRKGADTLSQLQKHYHKSPAAEKPIISFQPEIVDLTQLHTVKALSARLFKTTPKLDSLFLNAGIGGFAGLDWWMAIVCHLKSFKSALTWPTYKKSTIGSLAPLQCAQTSKKENGYMSTNSDGESIDVGFSEPPVGEVFCANVFGHYMLSHLLVPILEKPHALGRIIWISSLEAYHDAFTPSDLQLLRSPTPYEASKRLTDILAITAHLPSSKPWVDRYLSHHSSSTENSDITQTDRRDPTIYVAQPGICATEIVPLNMILTYLKIFFLYVARWVGSPWHTISPYVGACAPVWLALSPRSRLDKLEEDSGPGKWGSATDFWGEPRVVRTEIEGWGYGGILGDDTTRRRGRRRDAKDLTREAKEEFEEMGRQCWRQMEDLREDWEARLDGS